jgi:hypothetical protein
MEQATQTSGSSIAHSLRKEAEAARALLANIRDVIGDDDEAIVDAVEGETDLIEAISDAVARLDQLEAFEKALSEQMDALSDRRSRFKEQGDRIRQAILVAMGQAELRKLELATATLSVRAVAPKVEVVDESLVPSKFWKAQDPKLDKKAVLDALKAKETVPGATLSNGGETLSIKRG